MTYQDNLIMDCGKQGSMNAEDVDDKKIKNIQVCYLLMGHKWDELEMVTIEYLVDTIKNKIKQKSNQNNNNLSNLP